MKTKKINGKICLKKITKNDRISKKNYIKICLKKTNENKRIPKILT